MDDVDPRPVPTFASGSKTPKAVVGDEIISLLPYLQFADGTREHERFQRLRLLTPVSNIAIDWGFLETVGVREFTEDIIGVNTPWRRLFDITHPGHREITLEFYSTLAVRYVILYSFILSYTILQLVNILIIVSDPELRVRPRPRC